MLRAPPVAQASSLLVRRLPVGEASVQPSTSPFAHAWRITNPRYGRLPACATNHSARAPPAQAAVASGAMLRAPSVAQASNLLVRRLPVGETLVQPSASPPAHTSRITNPRYGRLPACATNHPTCAAPAQAAVASGAMLRAPSVAQASSLRVRRLPVGEASVQPSASPPAHTLRITNPRYGRLPACATNHPACAPPAQAAVASGAMLRAPSVAQIADPMPSTFRPAQLLHYALVPSESSSTTRRCKIFSQPPTPAAWRRWCLARQIPAARQAAGRCADWPSAA
jgi:hypothetical protein